MIAPVALVAVPTSISGGRQESPGADSAEQKPPAVSGLELAKLLLPAEVFRAQSAGIYAALVDTLLADHDDAVLEREHPGISAAISFAATTALRQAALARLPQLWERLGAVYTAALTEEEIKQALAFYRSPTGEWLLQQMRVGADLASLNRERLANPSREVVAVDLDHSREEAQQSLAATMTPEQQTALTAFVYSPLGKKIRDLKPTLRAIQLQWANAPSEGLREQLEAVVKDTTVKFIAAEAARSNQGKTHEH